MPTTTYTPLANITLGSSASSVTFSSIPNTFRDLVLIVSPVRGANGNTQIRFNGSDSTLYTQVRMFGDSNGFGGDSDSLTYIDLGTSASGYSSITQIMDYSTTDKHKSVLSRQNLPTAYTLGLTGRWANTQAITTVQVFTIADNFASGSSFALYGIVS